MAQVNFSNLTTEWVAFTDITTPADDTDYYLQNRGADIMLAVESAETPTTMAGMLVKPYEVLKYKKGNNPLWLRAYTSSCSVNVTDSTAGEVPPLWFEFMQDLTNDEQTPPTLSKTIDGYDVEMIWDSSDMETLTLTPSVEKDGESAGTSSVWWIVKDENGNELLRKEWTELTVEPTSEYSADITYIDGDDTYFDSISKETDVDTGLDVFVFDGTTKNGEPFGTAYLYIKCEQGE